MDKRFSWIVRFDVAGEWVADGFVMTDEAALDMLSEKISFADADTELAARVIAAPPAMRIANEQGYTVKHPQHNNLCETVMTDSPMAYRLTKGATLDAAIFDAIALLESVAFVTREGDTAPVLEKLHAALKLVRGIEPLPGESDAEDVGDESHHSHINGGDL